MASALLTIREGSGAPVASPQTSQQPTVAVAVSTILFFLSLLFVSLRFYTRIRHPLSNRGSNGLWWDDWTALMALMFLAPSYILICAMFSPILGRHLDTFSFQQQARGQAALNAFALLFMYSMFFARLSALLFYQRMLVTNQSTNFRKVLGVVHGFNLCVMISFMSLLSFACSITDTPPQRLLLECIPVQTMYISSAAASFASDFLVLLAPLPVVLRLDLPTGIHKALVMLPFGCGMVVVAVSFGRLVATIEQGSVLDGDVSYNGMSVLWWPVAEMAAALVSVCLPSIYGLVRRRFTQASQKSREKSWKSFTSHSTNVSAQRRGNSIPVASYFPGGLPPSAAYDARVSSSSSEPPQYPEDKSLPPTPLGNHQLPSSGYISSTVSDHRDRLIVSRAAPAGSTEQV